MAKHAVLFFMLVMLLTACNAGGDAEEHVESYYTHLQNQEFEEAVDYLSENLLDDMQMDEDTFVETYAQEDIDFDYTIAETEVFDEEALHDDFDDIQAIRNELDDDTDIYRVRVEVMYHEQGYDFPGIDDALIAEVDDEWEILGVFSFF